ncbi:sodium:calcium antiporter [Candidatus Woesearchaeota archaeon]|nr:sodium:calcium antiporter [Candidatus Woesearchaeota archaeon]
MALVFDLGVFIASCLVLVFAGGLLVRSLAKLASFLRMSEFVLAFLLMAISTSIPELFVGISAALQGTPSIALGTVIGSNIADLTLVAGVAALLGRGLKLKSRKIRKDAYVMFGIALLPVVLMAIGKQLSRLDGAILLGVLGLYLIRLIVQKKKYHATFHDHVSRWGVLGYFIVFVASILLLYFSSRYVVDAGSALAFDLSLPAIFIGLFFIAIGTSLPELVFESRAVLKGSSEMALGDLIGSVVFNSTLVLGIVALISPITANVFLFMTSSFFMIVVCLLFAVFLESGKGITWKEGVVLLFMYVLFLIVELNLKQFYLLNGL